jgi:TolB-like protein/thioredoxin-like negative regulator of GroEL
VSLLKELKRRNVLRVATAYAVTAWLIIQVVETTFPVFEISDGAIRIVIIVLVIGFVPAIIGAWVLQITPDGIKLDRDTADAPPAERAARLLDRSIIVILVIGIAYFAFDKFVLAPERVSEAEAEAASVAHAAAVSGFYGDRSIAVVPFDNLSADPEQQYLADGIAEEVLNLLARVRQLRVISRSSAFALRGENLEVPEIAARLNVAHVLEGSIRRAGNRIRVTAQLIDARSDTHLWSHTYERELDDVFQVQDDIAADVVANLQVNLLTELPRSRHIDPEVKSLTAQAEQLLQSRPDGTGRKSYALLTRALEIDPNSIPALDLMVGAYWFLMEEGTLDWDEAMRNIDAIYDRIRELDPDSARPDYYYAFMYVNENKLEEAAAMYSRALAKDLTIADNVRLAGIFARTIGKLDVSIRLLEFTLAIDPLCHQCRRRYAESLMYAGDYTSARREFERFMIASDDGVSGYANLLLLMGQPDEALRRLDAADSDDEYVALELRTARAKVLFSLGRIVEAEALYRELQQMDDFPDQRRLTFSLAEIAAWAGWTDIAFENLFALAATDFQYLRMRSFSPIWNNLHDDPRWAEFLDFNGMAPERLDAIEFDPDLPE